MRQRLTLVLLPLHVHASVFKGEALDKVAVVMTWIVLVIAAVIGIVVIKMFSYAWKLS